MTSRPPEPRAAAALEAAAGVGGDRPPVWIQDPNGAVVNLYSPVPPSSAPEAVARRYLQRLLVEHDLSVCEELLASDYVDHDAPDGTPPGPSATRAYAEGMLRDYPDLTFTIDELVAHGDTVALRATWRGSQAGTGTSLLRRGLVMLRVNEAGQIAERWSAYLEG